MQLGLVRIKGVGYILIAAWATVGLYVDLAFVVTLEAAVGACDTSGTDCGTCSGKQAVCLSLTGLAPLRNR